MSYGQDDDKDKATDPSTKSDAYKHMWPQWRKVDCLLGGTEVMRDAGKDYMPQHCEESDDAYRERLDSCVLFNATELTLDSWVGRPFARSMQTEGVPEEIVEDVDMQGNNLTTFCRSWFRSGLAKAFCHVYVDNPRKAAPAEGVQPTLADDAVQKIRPYWTLIPPENVIFARREIRDGQEVLTHVRILEETTEPDGFADKKVRRIRVVEPGLITVYREYEVGRDKREWRQEEQYSYDLPIVPLVTFYSSREDFMVGKSPISDLADLNIRHWQSTSDQISILTVTRFPILAMSGQANATARTMPDGSVDSSPQLVIGPNQWLHTPDPQGKFYYVEHGGGAINAGRQELRDLEEQMSAYGAGFLVKKPGNPTATARALDSAEATSPLQDSTTRFVDAVDMALYLTALWMKKPEAEWKASINTDFGPEEVQAADFSALASARTGRDLSRENYLSELKRRGTLSDDFDADENDRQLKSESMDFGDSVPPNTEGENEVPEKKVPGGDEPEGDDASAVGRNLQKGKALGASQGKVS